MHKLTLEFNKVDKDTRKQLATLILDYKDGLPRHAPIEHGEAILNAFENKPLRVVFESYEDYPEFAKTL